MRLVFCRQPANSTAMALRLYLVLTVLPYVLAALAVSVNTTRHETKRSCSAIGDIATVRSVPSWMPRSRPNLPPQSQAVATRLQTTQFNGVTGFYDGGSRWTDAVSHPPRHRVANIEFAVRRFQNTIEDIYNLMSLMNDNTWRDLIYQTQVGQLGVAHQNAWDSYFGGSFDDAGVGSYFDVYGRREFGEGILQWALLLYIRIRDFIGSGDGNFQNFEVRIGFSIRRASRSTTERPPGKHVPSLRLCCGRVVG